MEFNYQHTSMDAAVITFPDYAFQTQPLAPSQIKERIRLHATNTQTRDSVRATADQ